MEIAVQNPASSGSTDLNPDGCFSVSIADGVAHIELARPERFNAMTRAFWSELPAIIRDIDDNARARVIVISSTGKHFTAGMDLSVFAGQDQLTGTGVDRYVQAENFRHTAKLLQNSFSCLEDARMPVLVAIQGGCIGGGVDFTSACDIRYATNDAYFSIHEINLGMTADVGTFPRLCKLLPLGQVRELAYTGRRLSAAKAKELGLVNEVYADHATMMADVMAIAREIASKNPIAVTGSKVMINHARDHTTADTLDYIAVWNMALLAPEHMAEAMTAQREKRAALFPDLSPKLKSL
jgi:enoyl-CoA hydratase